MTARRLITLCAALLLSPAVLPAQPPLRRRPSPGPPGGAWRQAIRALEGAASPVLRRDPEALAVILSADGRLTYADEQPLPDGPVPGVDPRRRGPRRARAALYSVPR